jgi:hypothetical protein
MCLALSSELLNARKNFLFLASKERILCGSSFIHKENKNKLNSGLLTTIVPITHMKCKGYNLQSSKTYLYCKV